MLFSLMFSLMLSFRSFCKRMGGILLIGLMVMGCWLMSMPSTFALEAPTNQVAEVVSIHLGTIAGDLKFEPDVLGRVIN